MSWAVISQARCRPSTALKAAGFVQCVDVARAVMRELMAASGETTDLGIESDGRVVFVSQIESHHDIRAFHRAGAPVFNGHGEAIGALSVSGPTCA